ncbi:MAG: hypothetical protein PHX54_09530, partial [Lentimicrobiaceae bacterium]|nr:hypothetical protein [Lentimicrobiaceae bacterium]
PIWKLSFRPVFFLILTLNPVGVQLFPGRCGIVQPLWGCSLFAPFDNAEPCRGSTINNPQCSMAAAADIAELGVNQGRKPVEPCRGSTINNPNEAWLRQQTLRDWG